MSKNHICKIHEHKKKRCGHCHKSKGRLVHIGPPGPVGPQGPAGSIGSTGPTGPMPTIPSISSGSFQATLLPVRGVSDIWTGMAHYLKIGRIVYCTVYCPRMVTTGLSSLKLIMDYIPFPKDTNVVSGEGLVTGSNPTDPSLGTLCGTSAATNSFEVDFDLQDTDPQDGKIWNQLTFIFSYETSA